jgi:uncharacterized protein (TIGR00645 family)
MAEYDEEPTISESYEMNGLERSLETVIFASRWLLVPVFLGLVIALAGFSLSFMWQVLKFSVNLFSYEKNEMLLMVLTFVDKVLVAGLIIMVLIGGYENSIGKLNIAPNKSRLSWLGKVGSASLKVKLATSIVSISSIHLLKMFLDVTAYTNTELAWVTGIHFVMVITSLLLAYMDKPPAKK